MTIPFSTDELWVIATCAVCACACAIPGIFLILSRSSLLGDAISHAALPGIAAAFLISGSREPIWMILGALIAGLLTAVCSSFIHRSSIIKPDASLGIVFTSFFSIGVILISIGARHVDLDPSCVLYGLAEFIPFDTTRILSVEVPRSFVWLSTTLLINSILAALFWKELTITTFDPDLARALGYHPARVHYGLLACVTITVVASFEAVGSILVVSMLIAPAATAFLLSTSLPAIALISVTLGALSAVGGYVGALALNTSVAGMMTVVGGALFLAAVVFSPSQGLLSRYVVATRLRYRVVRDDILGLLFRWHEVADARSSPPLTGRDIYAAISNSLLTRLALRSLKQNRDILESTDGTLRLSERGLVEARALIRSHRLWEAYLAKHLGLPLDHLHDPSERTEHFIGRALAREIADDLEIESDPHGRTIPK